MRKNGTHMKKFENLCSKTYKELRPTKKMKMFAFAIFESRNKILNNKSNINISWKRGKEKYRRVFLWEKRCKKKWLDYSSENEIVTCINQPSHDLIKPRSSLLIYFSLGTFLNSSKPNTIFSDNLQLKFASLRGQFH